MKIAQDTSPQAADPLQVFVSFETATIHQPGLRGGGEVDVYIYTGSLCIDFSVLQCSIRRSRV